MNYSATEFEQQRSAGTDFIKNIKENWKKYVTHAMLIRLKLHVTSVKVGHMLYIKWNMADIKVLLAEYNCHQRLIFCDIIDSCLYIACNQWQDFRRPEGQVHVVPRDALWSRDKGSLGWMFTGPHLWWYAQQTKPVTIRPTANRFRAV